MIRNKKYLDAFHSHEDFMMKKRQYAKALHVFHEQTASYNEMIDDLSVKEMQTRQKEYLQHERDFHNVMDSFDRALGAYQETVDQLKTLKMPVQFEVGKKKFQMKVLKGVIDLKEI